MTDYPHFPMEAHVLATFACPRCGGEMRRLACCPVLPDGRIDITADLTQSAKMVCNDCLAVEHREQNHDDHTAAIARAAHALWLAKAERGDAANLLKGDT